MMLWLVGHPAVEQNLLSPERGRPAGQQRLRGLLQRVRRPSLRRPGVDQQRLGRPRRHRPRHPRVPGGLRALQQRAQPRLIGSVMIRHDRGELFCGPDPAARPARAHGRLRRRGSRAPAVLVVDRARQRSRAASLAHEGRTAVTVALGLVVVLASAGSIEGFVTPSAAHLGPHRHRRRWPRRRSSPTSSCSGRARRASAARPATCPTTSSRTPSPPRPEPSARAALRLQRQVVVGQRRRQLLGVGVDDGHARAA